MQGKTYFQKNYGESMSPETKITPSVEEQCLLDQILKIKKVNWKIFIQASEENKSLEYVKSVLIKKGILKGKKESIGRRVCIVTITKTNICTRCLSLWGEPLYFPPNKEEALRFVSALAEILEKQNNTEEIYIEKVLLIEASVYKKEPDCQTKLPVQF